MQVKKSEKREQILRAALKLFSEKPFEDVTTDMIAKEARVGKGTIYTYFKTKDEIFVKGFSSMAEEFVLKAREVKRCECGVVEKLEKLFESYYSISSGQESLWHVFMKLYLDDRLSKVRADFQKALKEEIRGIFESFESRLNGSTEEITNFVIVNVMPFGMKHYAQNEKYWKFAVEAVKRGIFKSENSG